MAEEKLTLKQRWENWKERSREDYRLVIMHNDTFEELNSFKLTLLNLYILISAILVAMALFVIFLLAITPLGRMILGGASADTSSVIELYEKVSDLERKVQGQEVYNAHLRRLLTGIPSDGSIPASKSLSISGEEPSVVLAAQKMANQRYKLQLRDMEFMTPLKGSVGYGFKSTESHFGVDISAPANSPIKAALSGTVIQADWTLESGNTLALLHDGNVVTFYRHNSSLLKKVGQKVKAGEAIAIIGNTGKLTNGPHLHFEIWHEGRPIDPQKVILFQ
jgi:murein DD-endopeptidase MepM/ murein hydrolase activator NlpD